MNSCPVCKFPADYSVSLDGSGISIDSLGNVLSRSIDIYSCGRCNHVFKPSLINSESYYSNDYGISLWHNEADQLYEVLSNGVTLFRQQHQFNVMNSIVPIKSNMNVLDYGAARGQMAQIMKASFPEMSVYLYDISKGYLPFWSEFLDPERYSLRISQDWADLFDLVYSFFVFEHTEDLSYAFSQIDSVLRVNGYLYFVVPNFHDNCGDLLVSDHVNHFTKTSINFLARKNGYEVLRLDDESHRGAFCVLLKKLDSKVSKLSNMLEVGASTKLDTQKFIDFWATTKSDLIRELNNFPDAKVGIFGAGFYGSLVYTWLSNFVKINAFYDNNTTLKNQEKFGIPILPTSEISKEEFIIFAVNPKIAVETLSEVLVHLSSSSKVFTFRNPSHTVL